MEKNPTAWLVAGVFCLTAMAALSQQEPDSRLQSQGSAWGFSSAKTNDPSLPRVLLMGDSILNGYLPVVVKELTGTANVDAWVNPYHQASPQLPGELRKVLSHGPYAVIHFNMGLHGWPKGRIPDGQFEPLMRQYVNMVRNQSGDAALIWASTTPVMVAGKPQELNPEINPIILEHNSLAAKVATEEKIPVDDLYSLMADKRKFAKGDIAHWRPEGYSIMGKQVADMIRQKLRPRTGFSNTNADDAFLIGAEQAELLKSEPTGTPAKPELEFRPDKYGFAATQIIAPVKPEAGALVWKLNVSKPGRYLATLEFAQQQEGNAFEVRVGSEVLKGFAPGTRDNMILLELGEIDFAAGQQSLMLSNTTAIDGKTFMSVGSIYLRPASQETMTLPQIRAAICKQTPRKLPSELLMPDIFSDHMVLQRGKPVPVWGCAAPGADVTVKCRHQTQHAQTDAEGHWMIQLDPMDAGDPYEMEISDGRKTVHLLDVLVGEVWLGSGQSNMEVAAKPLPQFTTTSHPFDCDEATRQLLAAGAKLDIRISAVTRDHWKNPHWAVLSKENFLEAPALMTSVATLLREKLDVPVGVIVRCESSSTSGIWLSRDAVENDAEIQRQIRNYATNEYPRLVAAYPRRVKDWEAAAAKAKAAGGKIPVKPAAPTLPGGFPVNRGFSGNVFYSEGRLNHYGVNYVTRIEPVIPFAVRGIVWDQGENGTGIAGADQTAVMPALVRSWRAAWGSDNLPFFYIRKNQHPATLPEVMATLPDTFQIDNRGLSQITHPPDKSAYARRVVEQMELHIYNQNGLPK